MSLILDLPASMPPRLRNAAVGGGPLEAVGCVALLLAEKRPELIVLDYDRTAAALSQITWDLSIADLRRRR